MKTENIMDTLYCGFWWSVIVAEIVLVIGIIIGTPVLIWFLAH